MFKMSGLPDGMANGPSQSCLDGKDQIWERAWSLDQMRETSTNWSLAADSGLFLFLQDFSQRMLSKTHEIEKQLEGLIRDTKATDSCLHTVFNDFLMLSNTQFIENRVYDEEVEDPVPKVEATERQAEPEKTREQKEAELIPKMQEAVNYGLKVLDSAFEQLDIKAGNSDSEEEEATDRVEPILEPKDLYVDRPLPYLIGSQLFMEQEDVGLGDLSSEEMSIDSDRDSVIESEDGKETDQSDEDFDQEGEAHGGIKKKSSMLSYEEEDEEDEDGDSDIFGDSDKDDDDDEDRENSGPSTFADELAARIKGEPISKLEGDRTSLSSASKKKSKAKKHAKPARPPAVDDNSDELFKPPKMEDEDFSPFGGQGGLFSGGRGLFDDDDEGDLFSDAPKHPVAEEPARRSRAQTSEPAKPAKTPSGAVPDNRLFGSGNYSDSMESRENGSPVKPRSQTAPRQAPAGGVGGLFDDDEEDDFFSGKGLKKSSSAGQEKAKQKKTVDLFGGDDEDEDGDIFSERSNAPPPLQSKKEVVEEQVKQALPEKKIPAGAVSMFGPDTKTLLTARDESQKSEENGSPPDILKVPAKPTEKPQTRSLFSDDEDSQVFPSIPKSQSKPETTTQSKGRKAPLSIFDDEEEEDLFASASKSTSTRSKATAPEVKKLVTSSLFSDDEDQWLSSKPSAEAVPGGMKPSASAPSGFLSARAAQTGSLFDEEEDHLFAAAKISSQKKPQRVSLLFEDEAEEKGFLFDFKPPANNSTPPPVTKASAEAVLGPSLFDSDQVAVPQTSDGTSPGEETAVAEKIPDVQSPSSPLEGSEAKKKPAGAISLFGGIDVLAGKQSKSPLDEPDGDDDFLAKNRPLPVEREREGEKEEEKDVKTQKNTLSLFDEEEEEEEEEVADWTAPISIPSKPASKNTLQTPEERPRTKSTGVFQDEELLFSRTQQKDNDPDVDLFTTSAKTLSTKPSSAKVAAAPTLFADDDEDDLFSSVKPKAPPPVSEKPSKASREESASKPAPRAAVPETEANLQINPAALLPGVSRVPAGGGGLPGLSPSLSPEDPSPVTSPAGTQDASHGGVSFDCPAQVTTLQSTNKGRPKGSVRRRPQTRAARQLAAQSSEENQGEGSGPNPALPSPALPNPSRTTQDLPSPALPNPGPITALPPHPPLADGSARPSVLTLPVSTNPKKTDSARRSSKPKVLPSPDVDDLFGSDSLFGSAPAPKQTTPSPTPKTKTAEDAAGGIAALGKEKPRDAAPSIFDDHGDDLFQKVKPRSAQKPKASAFLEEDDDEEDIFGMGKSSTPTAAPKTSSNFSKQDVFQDQVEPFHKGNKKHKDKSLDASLFDDNVDIFADFTVASKPKEKSKKKVETKSIFDDDMDDIFSSSAGKAVAKPSVKPQKGRPSQDPGTAEDSTGNMFDDPLNALGGN